MKHLFRILAGTLLGLALVACHGPQGQADADASMQLKIYDVPAQRTNDLRNALNATIVSKRIRATTAAPGKLLVYAPRDAQASIASVIAELVKAPVDDTAPAGLQVHFWVVDALPGAGDDDPALDPLAGTLQTLRASRGPLHFTLDEAVTAAATLDQQGRIGTGEQRLFQFTARSGQDNGINLEVVYVDRDSQGMKELSTTISMVSGQYIMLAQAPLTSAEDSTASARRAMRLLVMRVDRPAPSRH